MDTNVVLSSLFLFVIPLLGLALGAIFPPFRYAKHPGLAGCCNILGFLLYIFPFSMSAIALSFFGEGNDFALIMLFVTATFFFCIEALVFFLLWLRKRLRAPHS